VRPDAAVPRPLPVEPVTTLANVITLVRTVAAVSIGVVALRQESLALVAVGYGVYWVGDIADGAAARWRDQETRQGGVFDVVSDRACTSVLAAGFIVVRPEAAVPLGVFLVQFMVLDCVLTLAFLHWPIVSPNYFHVVDRRVYRLNWSQPAKAANTGAVVVFLALGWIAVATVVAVAVAVLKVWSLREVARLVDRRGSPAAACAPLAEPAS
jgi:CDP-diacylglycerol--glycerol-3-phosphate 3-phosphatidyltransferase